MRADSSPGTDLGAQITSAYNSAPSTGAYLYLGEDETISSPTTITMVAGKPLILDLAGRTLTFAHTSGTGLAFAKGSGNVRNMRITIRNGTIVYGGSAKGITGLSVTGIGYVTFSNLQILAFSTASSVAVDWNFVEDSVIENTEFRRNYIALILNNAANQNEFRNVWFQENSTAVNILNGSQSNTFLDCLFQSNTAASAVNLVSSAGDSYPFVTNNRFIGCWFENNGDGTSSSVAVFMKADAGRSITYNTFDNNIWAGDTQGAKGAAMGFTGAGTIGYNTYRNNWYGSTFTLGRSIGKELAPIVVNDFNQGTSSISGVGIGTTAPDTLLTVNGDADKPGGGSWGTYSDARLKAVGDNFRAGLPEVLKLNPIYYRYKEENALGITDHDQHVGLVGQEVEKVIPDAVSRNSQGYLVLNNDPIQWAMLNAIKEQQAQIQALTREVQDLRARGRKLTRQVVEPKKVHPQSATSEARSAQVRARAAKPQPKTVEHTAPGKPGPRSATVAKAQF